MSMLSSWSLQSLTIKEGPRISVSAAFHSMDIRIRAAIPHAFPSTDRSAKLQWEGRQLLANCFHLSDFCLWRHVLSQF